nr:MAG TPA: GDSL like Lipase Acylhydrolase [Caudoviricetes sp.]
MVIVAFKPGEKEISKYEELDQYDYGQILRIQGLNLPPAVEIHFALQKTGGTSKTRIGITKDGVTDVPIPDSMLENEDETKDYDIYAFIYITDETSGQTEYRITLKVKARPKPEAFDRPEDAEIFKEAIKAVNESAARSAESEKQAEGWAHGREDLPERTQDNAKYYSDQAREDSMKTDADRKEVGRLVESVSGIGEQVEKVEGLTKQAQTSATNAALSEQAAKESENNAAQARAGAEVAEDNAELAAQRAEQDKAIVEQAKNLVKQMGQEVLDNKKLVDEMAQDFDLKAQQALADVNNAGQTQTERVQTAGNDAVESVKKAQGTATRAVETAKTEAIEAVQTEGTTQTGNVAAEGEKQVQAVRGAAQEIVEDRGQIQENKTGIAKLKEDLSRVEKDTYVKKEIEKEKKEWVDIDLTSGYSDGCFDKDKKRINWTNMNYSHHVYDVKEGEKYKINARVPDANIPLIVFTDIENNTIDFLPNPITTVRITSEVIIPAGSTKMYVNHNGVTDNTNSYYLWELSKYVVTPAVIEKKPIKDYVVSNLFGKKIVCNGDSIVKGQGYYGDSKGDKSYVNIIAEKYNMNCINYAVSGGTLSSGSNVNVHHICDDVMNMDVDADYIIVGGGYNDWLYNTPLGEITNNYTDEVNANGRVLGGAELLCRNLLSRFKGKKVGFVFSHKIKESPYTQNKSWDNKPYTMTECHDEIVSVLRKYSIPYLDLYNDSALNTALSDYLLYTANSDGTHPTKEGYEIFYCDKFENFLLSL